MRASTRTPAAAVAILASSAMLAGSASAGRITGTVRDGAFDPKDDAGAIAAVAVRCRLQAVPEKVIDVRTNARGYFECRDAPPGYFVVEFEKPGYTPKPGKNALQLADNMRVELELYQMRPEMAGYWTRMADRIVAEHDASEYADALAELEALGVPQEGLDAARNRIYRYAPENPEMSAEEKAMMAAYEKASALGPQHARLATAAGKWDLTVKSWMSPDSPPMESKGTAERSVILGGRVLEEKVNSQMMGTPFEGQGMTGYDSVTGQYWGTWNDSMSTGLFVMHGTCDDKGACTFTGSYMDPMTGKEKTTRSTSRRSADKEVVEIFETGADGKEMKTMELTYARATAESDYN